MLRLVHAVRALTLSSLLMAASAIAATTDTPPSADTPQARTILLDAVCEKVVCRKAAHDITLRLPETENLFKVKSALYPYLDQQGTVILYPGDIIAIAIDKNGDALGEARLLHVEDAAGPVDVGGPPQPDTGAGTLSFNLQQNKDDAGMTLVVTNTIDATIKYTAQIFVPTSKGMQSGRTSICPLSPPQKPAASFTGHEAWPYPIAMAVITNIHALPKGSPMSCD